MAITVPPDDWFRGIARALFDRYRQALIDLGIALFEVPLDAFVIPDATRIPRLIDDLRAFRPECAFGLPFGSYALICRLPPGRSGWRPNLFTDVLDLPTICLWDHAPVELADQLLMPHPAGPAASSPGARDALARVLAHPRLIHWSRDSGQTRIMRELGFLLPNRLIEEMPPQLPGFVPSERSAAASTVGFIGHVYQDVPGHSDPTLASIAEAALRTWLDSGERTPLWDVLLQEVARLAEPEVQRLSMDPDQTYFWRFAHQLICHRAQTALRLTLLGGAGVPVECHGNLRADRDGVPGNLIPVPTHVPYGPELSALFARHAIVIDVLSPGFVHGYSHKQVHGFASGGFMLMNRRQDFVDAFGDVGEAVSCTGPEDVGAKVDRFLTNVRHRRQVGDEIRETIRARYQLHDVLARAIDAAAGCMEAMDSRRAASGAPVPRTSTTVQDLLPGIRSKPQWPGIVQHGVEGARVETGADAWRYAAFVPLPATVSDLHEPHLRLTLMVETGRVGLALLRDEVLVSEQVVSPTASPVTVTVELPHEGARSVIVRNVVGEVSRALVIEALLCERAVN